MAAPLHSIPAAPAVAMIPPRRAAVYLPECSVRLPVRSTCCELRCGNAGSYYAVDGVLPAEEEDVEADRISTSAKFLCKDRHYSAPSELIAQGLNTISLWNGSFARLARAFSFHLAIRPRAADLASLNGKKSGNEGYCPGFPKAPIKSRLAIISQ